MRQHPTQFPHPMLRLFQARSLDKYRDSKGIQQEQARTPQWDRKRAHKQRPGSLAEFRLPACRWELSRSSLPIGRWFLDFLYLEPSHAGAGLRPSRQIAAPGTRFPNPSSIECCQPSAAPRLDIPPMTECLGPTAVLLQRPPVPCLANFCSYPSTAEVEQLQVGKSKRRASEPGASPDITQSARPKNPIQHSEAREPVPCPRLLCS
jgi:hypothetical protein